MRKNIFILFISLSVLVVKAQIGINTENPQAIFHIDGLSNNNIIPTATQQVDDVYMSTGYNDEAIMSIGSLPNNNTQLMLTDKNKAFLPNKVALKSQLDITTIPFPETGMLVYNTATVSGIDGVIPGLYVYDVNKWRYVFTEESKKLQYRQLITQTTTPGCPANGYNCATIMDFGEDILIPETGAYGVGINLYGKPKTNIAAPRRSIIYIWLFANDIPVDVAELNPTEFKNGGAFTYTVFLGGKFNAGDKLACRISHRNTTDPSYTLTMEPSLTFMMYWRLEQASTVE